MGQSLSLIVGLGDYEGGELCVEGSVHKVRYQPLEFNGWKERHWTLPFQGERFSLVFFTPAETVVKDIEENPRDRSEKEPSRIPNPNPNPNPNRLENEASRIVKDHSMMHRPLSNDANVIIEIFKDEIEP